MNATEQHVAMAAKMYECRAAARRLLGDKFNQQMDERARVVRAVAKRDNCNEIVAGATVIKEAGLQGMDALLLMAAVVEMTEPSNVICTPNGVQHHRARSALFLKNQTFICPSQVFHPFAAFIAPDFLCLVPCLWATGFGMGG